MIVKDMLTGIETEVDDIILDPIVLTAEQLEQQYKDRVVSLIRDNYTADDEFAMIRKNIAGINTAEFAEYNTYAEGCKAQAKAEFGI